MNPSSEVKSRTQVKKEAQKLQELGSDLLSLSKDQIEGLDIPRELKDAVIHAKTITSKNAKRRQIQYIGALMRKIDTAPLVSSLDYLKAGLSSKGMTAEQSTRWYNDILSGDDSPIDEIISLCPGSDLQKLRQLIRNSRKEVANEKPGKSSKKLLSYLRELLLG